MKENSLARKILSKKTIYSMLNFIRNFLADQPVLFSWLRKIMELNFSQQKKIIKETFDLKSEKKILDIGCGTGEFAGLLNRTGYYGIDISIRYIEYAAKHNRGNFKVMDAKKLEFPDNTFDYILIMAILHHLNDSEARRVLAEAARVLKPDGKILVIEDAKIIKSENFIDRFLQSYDKGAFIRTPEQYKNMVADLFTVNSEQSFRSGCFIYYSLSSKSNKHFYDI